MRVDTPQNNPKLDYIRNLFAKEDDLLKSIQEQCKKDNRPININPEEGKILQFLIKSLNIKSIVEIGTFYGYSSIWMVRALPKDGALYTIEKDDKSVEIAEENFRKLKRKSDLYTPEKNESSKDWGVSQESKRFIQLTTTPHSPLVGESRKQACKGEADSVGGYNISKGNWAERCEGATSPFAQSYDFAQEKSNPSPPEKKGSPKRWGVSQNQTLAHAPLIREDSKAELCKGVSSHLPYRPDLKEKATEQRNNLSPFEKKVWYEVLSNRKINNYKFTRQKPILDYIVDFYCAELGLIIEIDGITHCGDNNIEYDKTRTKRLEELGLEIVRYSNSQVSDNIEGIYRDLEIKTENRKQFLKSQQTPQLLRSHPPYQGGKNRLSQKNPYQESESITLLQGNAIDELNKLSSKAPFDMIFIDADKNNYLNYLDWAEKNIKKGGLIVADNTFLFGAVYMDELPYRTRPTTKKIMQEFNKRLSNPDKYQSIMIPTEEGLTIALKLF